MPLPAELRPGSEVARRIALAVAYRCELCGDEWPGHLPEIHFIPGAGAVPSRREDLHRWILVLCIRGHRDLHRHNCPVRDQVYLVSVRDLQIGREIHRILHSHSRPYSAPDTFDPERFFLDPSPVPWGWVV